MTSDTKTYLFSTIDATMFKHFFIKNNAHECKKLVSASEIATTILTFELTTQTPRSKWTNIKLDDLGVY